MKAQKLRSEIDDKFKWDLSSMYSSFTDVENDFKKCEELEEEIQKYKNKNLDENSLYELIKLDLDINRILEKLIVYSSLKLAEDSTDDTNQSLYLKIHDFSQNIYTKISFIPNLIYKLDYKTVTDYINKNDNLKQYSFLLQVMFREKEHKLTDEEEKLVSSLTHALTLPSETYDMLCNSDIKFGNIKDENGKDVELTDSNFSIFAKSKNRKVRQNAFERYYSTYGNYKNTLATIYSSHLKTVSILSKLKKYDSTLSEDMSSDNLPLELYDNLINTVNSNLDILHKYYKIRKDISGLEEFHIYDKSAPVTEEFNKDFSYEDAQKIILDIFKIMGDDYVDILKKAFNERWIDVYNNKGKDSGAFSSGVYDSNPFVLTNYENKFEDVSTIAHELGHSVHTYYSIHNNSYAYYDYSHFIAEVASLTNEIIFHKKMIESTNSKEEKKYILNHLLILYISNFFDAVLYAEFEKDVHDKVENNDIITSDYLCNLCYDLNKKYYGKYVVIDEEVKYRWEIYSHLYVDYYLYKYATGISCATYCANKILNDDKEFIEKYKEFLKLGSSCYSNEALLKIGIDVTKVEFIEDAIKFFNNLLDEFIKLN